MNNLKSILAATVLIVTMTMVSCKDKTTETKTETVTETETAIENSTEVKGKEYTAAYVCPMHCADSGSDTEGNCGSCGMALVKNEDHTANGHTHE